MISINRCAAVLFLLHLIHIQPSMAQIGGQVTDATTGDVVTNANISVPETTIGTSSNKSGLFRLEWYSFPIRLQVSAIGYETRFITVFESTQTLPVALVPKVYVSEEITIDHQRIDIQNVRTRPIPVTSIGPSSREHSLDGQSVDLLRSEKGVYVQQTTPGQGSVYIRGRAGRDVLYMFNGLRMNPSFVRSGQNQYFGTIDPFNTHQINVFRGPVSVYYGSDALSGGVDVVPIVKPFSNAPDWSGQVITQANLEGTGERTLHSNTYYTSSRLSVYLGGTIRRFQYYRMPSRSDESLWFPYENNRIHDLEYYQLAYLGSVRYRISSTKQLRFVSYSGVVPDAPRIDQMVMGYSLQSDSGINAPAFAYASNTAPLRFTAHSMSLQSSVQSRYISTANIRVGYHQLKDHRIEVAYESAPDYTQGIRDFTEADRAGYDQNTSDQLIFSFDLMGTPTNSTLVRVGGDLSTDFVSSERYIADRGTDARIAERLPRYPDGSRYTQSGLFVHLTQNVSPVLWAEGGLRYSYIDAYLNFEGAGSERDFNPMRDQYMYTTGSAGLTWSPVTHLYLTTNISTGFRAPNIADLAEVGTRRSRFYQVPGSNLRPEHTRNLDLSVRWINNVLNFELTGYRVQYNDKIESVPTGNTITDRNGLELIETANMNVSSMLLYGVESSVEYKFRDIWTAGLIFNYTYGEVSGADGGVRPVDRIPPANGQIYVRHRLSETISLSAQARYAFAQRRLAESELQDFRISNDGTDGFVVLQLVANWQLNESSELRVFADNLTDAVYREHGSTLDGLGRNVSLRYSWKF